MTYYLLLITIIGSLFSAHVIAKDIDYKSYYDNGQIKASGTLRDGLKEGKWTYWDSQGNKTEEAHYKNGDKHGRAISWPYQEYIVTAEYKDDLLHGDFKSEDIKTKEPFIYGRFENNKREGEWYFGKTSYRKVETVIHFKDGKPQ